MSLAERKSSFEIAVDEAKKGNYQAVMSCSDKNLDTVIELAKRAEASRSQL